MSNVLIVAAHSDDEVLGCGGTIAKHTSSGDRVSVVFMTNGIGSRLDTGSKDIANRKSAAHKAAEVLGVSDIYQFDFPDNKMDSIPVLDIVQKLESVIEKELPDTIYTHFAHDLNVDHRITLQSVMTACRPQSSSSVKKILSFEVLSSTEWQSKALAQFTPHYIVNISEHWEKKMAAISCYAEEMREAPHSRSNKCIEALAVLRGNSNGFDKAEAFFVERIRCE